MRLIRADETLDIPQTLPVIALRDLVFFPYMVLPLLIGRPPSVAALAAAEEGERLLLVVAQKDAAIRDPTEDEIHHAGCVVRVVEVTRLPDGTARVVFEGVARARLTRLGITERGFAGSQQAS